jgi:hypothetical protein
LVGWFWFGGRVHLKTIFVSLGVLKGSFEGGRKAFEEKKIN